MKELLLPKIKYVLAKVSFMMLIFGSYGYMVAQTCTLACGNINIGLSGACQTEVFPEQVSTDLSDFCTYDLTFIRVGNPAAPPILTSSDIGNVVMYTLTDSNGFSCNGQITTSSAGGPSVFCPDGPFVIECGQDLSTLPAPPAVSCNGPVNSTLIEIREIQAADCSTPFYRIVEIEYGYTDAANETASCTVTYQITATDINTIEAPADITLECAPALDISTSALGVPTNDGAPFIPSTSCNITISNPVDIRSFGCGNTEIITRTWSMQDMCALDPAAIITISQEITIEDLLDPTIDLPAGPINVSTSPLNCESGDIILPAATIFDQCSDLDQLTVQMIIPFIGPVNGNGSTVSGLPVGTHEVLYRVTDACGNSSTASINVIVSDNVPPDESCQSDRTITLNNLGTAIIPATIFNDGSSDNCGGPVYIKVRRMSPSDCDPNPEFDDTITFCCSDVGSPVSVILRVYDVDPGSGPVGENDFLANSSECMVDAIVQDKLPPTVLCPADATVDCEFDLDFYLTNDIPLSMDNCNENLDATVSMDLTGLNDCGVGEAIRTITYTDGTNEIVCIQNIEIENTVIGGGISIDWPENVMIASCGGSVEPEDLEEGFSMPVVTVEGCAEITMSHEDIVFDIVEDACFKVVRTWEVIDSCTFNMTTGEGWFIHHQLIKVIDEENPEIVGLNNVDFVLSVDEDCDVTEAFVNIPEITANDCTPLEQMTFRYRIDYGNNGHYDTPFELGNNASGVYPMGESLVQFRVDDLCGNLSYGSFIVSVALEDTTKPSPKLKNLSTSLMPGMQMVTIQASLFNVESDDNCTAPDALTFSFSSDRDSTERIFTCDDLDTAFVTIYVWDEAGNSDFVEVKLAITDNANDCPDNIGGGGGQVAISGRIFNEEDREIESVMVSLLQSTMNPVETNDEGYFTFEGAHLNSSYELCPTKTNDPRNGVNVLDLIRIQRHILGIERLNSPYKMIAADVNRNGTISGTDLVAIHRVLLGYAQDFAGEATWRFLDADYEFNDPLYPLGEEFPEVYNISNLEGEVTKNFIGMKIGDVDNSARLSSNFQQANPRGFQDLTFEVEDRWIEKGESVYVSVKAKEFRKVYGFQGTLQFDPSKAQFMGITSGQLQGFSKNAINTDLIQEGIIPMVWYSEQGLSLNDGDEIFRIKLYVTEHTFIGDLLSIGDTFIDNIQVSQKGSGLLKMGFFNYDESQRDIRLLQNKPNPFDSETIVSFYLKENTEATISIMDMAGRIVWSQQGSYTKGNNDITVNKNILGGSGVYLYRLDAPGFSDTKKMVLVSN